MGQSTSVWVVIVLALIAANLPFMSQRQLAVVKLTAGKNLAVRLAELVIMYFLVGGTALLLENRLGQIAPQNWEFYAITYFVFLVFAYPGFVYCYLWRGR